MANSEIIGAGQDTSRRAPKKYQIIYADPPWKYGDKVLNNGHGKRFDGLDRHYGVMTTKDICAINVKEITDENAVLFLWSTDSHLPDALSVIKSWGFTYKTVGFYWIKTSKKTGEFQSNLGKWTQKSGELCLFATRGKCSNLLVSRKVKQLVLSARLGHSQKPAEVRNRIVEMFGDIPRIELFARQRVEGWDAWGNEIEESPVLGEEGPAQNTVEICHTVPNSASPKAAQVTMELGL